MSKHTPGPWSYDSLDRVVIRAGIEDIAHMDKTASDADARLIAAAPEMLEELEYRYEQGKCGCGHLACKRCEDDRRTMKVINKAKGET
jgi:predicted ATP-grasp superfamily ATP-dependent carboligase